MGQEAVRLWMSDAPETRQQELTVLLEKACTGDMASFEQVLFRTERSVMATARRMLGNTADAEEATQEVFLRVYKYLHRFDRSKPFEPWLFRLTVNVCNDIGSRRTRRNETSSTDAGETASIGDDPQDFLDVEDRRRWIHQALGELSARQRATVVLRDLQGLSTREVASTLQVSQAAVRSHLSAARVRMKRFLEKRFGRLL